MEHQYMLDLIGVRQVGRLTMFVSQRQDRCQSQKSTEQR